MQLELSAPTTKTQQIPSCRRKRLPGVLSVTYISASRLRFARLHRIRPVGGMAEKVAETWITTPKRLMSAANREACLVHIYPTGPNMGCRYPLGEQSLVLGRGEDCDIRLQDHSVSRKHARIEATPDGYFVFDQQSTNGTFVNDKQLDPSWLLQDGDYLRIGNCIYRYLAGVTSGGIPRESTGSPFSMALRKSTTRHTWPGSGGKSCGRNARPPRSLDDRPRQVQDDQRLVRPPVRRFVLREMADIIKGAFAEDLFAHGGEEFVLVLVDRPRQRWNRRSDSPVGGRPAFSGSRRRVKLTISIGIACMSGDMTVTPAGLLAARARTSIRPSDRVATRSSLRNRSTNHRIGEKSRAAFSAIRPGIGRAANTSGSSRTDLQDREILAPALPPISDRTNDSSPQS